MRMRLYVIYNAFIIKNESDTVTGHFLPADLFNLIRYERREILQTDTCILYFGDRLHISQFIRMFLKLILNGGIVGHPVNAIQRKDFFPCAVFCLSRRQASCLLLLALGLGHGLLRLAGESARAFIIIQIVENINPGISVSQHFRKHSFRVPFAPAVCVDIGLAKLLQFRLVVVPEDGFSDAFRELRISALAHMEILMPRDLLCRRVRIVNRTCRPSRSA